MARPTASRSIRSARIGLLKGVDEINLTLGYKPEIACFEERQRRELSWL